MQCKRRAAREIRARSWHGRQEKISNKISSGTCGGIIVVRVDVWEVEGA